MFPLCDEVITSTNCAQTLMFLVRFECRPAVGNNCPLSLCRTTEPSVSLALRPSKKTWNLHTGEKKTNTETATRIKTERSNTKLDKLDNTMSYLSLLAIIFTKESSILTQNVQLPLKP